MPSGKPSRQTSRAVGGGPAPKDLVKSYGRAPAATASVPVLRAKNASAAQQVASSAIGAGFGPYSHLASSGAGPSHSPNTWDSDSTMSGDAAQPLLADSRLVRISEDKAKSTFSNSVADATAGPILSNRKNVSLNGSSRTRYSGTSTESGHMPGSSSSHRDQPALYWAITDKEDDDDFVSAAIAPPKGQC